MKSATESVSLALWSDNLVPARKNDTNIALLRERAGSNWSQLMAPATCSMLEVLETLGADVETVVAAIWVDLKLSEAPKNLYGLVEGQLEAEKVWALYRERGGADAEGLRRLLLALVKDVRVVFVLIARQLSRMRSATQASSEEKNWLSRLASDIHAPLAARLGMWQVKWELEDFVFRYLEPQAYKKIAGMLDEKRTDRERYIFDMIGFLQKTMKDAGIVADIAGRPKHIYSIWKKMQRKQIDFEALTDIRAVRIMVKDVPACYAALGIVHGLWPYLPKEFDDYIANPKGNLYRSLHTAVIGPESKTVEVQIRTQEMHDHAELGVAAHWRYKEGGSSDTAFERKISLMRQLLDNRDEQVDANAMFSNLRTDAMLEDRVYVLTPQGKVVDMVRGATVLDFAYLVHTEVGHRCRGAKVGGRLMPLTYKPGSGDVVEIVTGKISAPRRDWLLSNAGFLTTNRAKEKVRAWFRKSEHEKNLAAGREVLDKELKRLALPNLEHAALAKHFQLDKVDEFYTMLGIGEIGAAQVARAAHEFTHENKATDSPVITTTTRKRKRNKDAILIEGVGNLLTQMAKCCQPVPGDAIMGYLTLLRGVSIHRRDCKSLFALLGRSPERVIEVQWGRGDQQAYEVDVSVRALDRKGLLKDVSSIFASADADVLKASSDVDSADRIALMRFTLRVTDFAQLSGILGKVSALPNVLEAKRVAATR